MCPTRVLSRIYSNTYKFVLYHPTEGIWNASPDPYGLEEALLERGRLLKGEG